MAKQYEADIGTRPEQIPTNSMLGELAFADVDFLYPIGAVYSCVNAKAPTVGTWEQIGTEAIGAETVTYFKRTA